MAILKRFVDWITGPPRDRSKIRELEAKLERMNAERETLHAIQAIVDNADSLDDVLAGLGDLLSQTEANAGRVPQSVVDARCHYISQTISEIRES